MDGRTAELLVRRAKLDKGMVVLLDRERGRMKDRKSLQVKKNKYIGKDVPTGRGKHGWVVAGWNCGAEMRWTGTRSLGWTRAVALMVERTELDRTGTRGWYCC